MSGLFVSFEGVDGVGKTTQVERLRAYLEAQGRTVVVTREPGGTALGKAIRQLLLHGVDGGADRYLDSSLAYQAGGRELTPEEIRSLSMWATNNLLPDRTYLLDMDPALSHHRLEHAEDRMESAGDDFQSRTRQAFLDLAAAEPNRFRVIDASQSIEAVWAAIESDIKELA